MVSTEERVRRYYKQTGRIALTGRQVRRCIRKGLKHGDLCGERMGNEMCFLHDGHFHWDMTEEATPHESYSFVWGPVIGTPG